MNRHFTQAAVLFLALSFGLMVGCEQNKNPIPPGGGGDNSVASIELRLSHNQISGLAGETRTVNVTAIARNNQGLAVQNAKITFAIQGPQIWKGTISPESNQDTVTNVNGEFLGVYSVELERSGDVTIEARNGSVIATKDITLNVVEVGNVSLEAVNVLTVAPNRTKQTTITASVQDLDGVGISGILVRFKTSPPQLGTVDSDTGTTDFNGQIQKTFTTVANSYGTCQISAEVGTVVDSTTIEIRAVSEPAFIDLMADTPTIRVAEGANADINLTAVVTDENRVGVPAAKVEFTVEPFAPGGPTFGVVTANDTLSETDDFGRINATFSTLGGDGRVFVVARVLPSGFSGTSAPIETRRAVRLKRGREVVKGGGVTAGTDDEAIEDRVLITVSRLNQEIGNLTLFATSTFLNLPPDSMGTVQIMAQVKDFSGVGIGNVFLDFTTDLGRLANPTVTDSTGVASASYFILPATDFSNPEDAEEIATITASIPGTAQQESVQIRIKRFTQERGTLSLTTDKTILYADGNDSTYATITCLLKDADFAVIPGATINFSSQFGSIPRSAVTDTTGRVKLRYNDVGNPSMDENENIVPDVIIAKYNEGQLEEYLEITIMPRNPVRQILLSAARQVLTAGSSDSTLIRATCIQENGERAPDGTEVEFRTTLGGFTADRAYIFGGFGTAETYFITPNTTGTAVITAMVHNAEGDSAVSEELAIQILPGPPNRVFVNANPRSIVTNDPNQFSTITASVVDTAGNAVEQGKLVRFTSTLGTVTPSAITDTLGRAIVRLTSGVQAGVAVVTAEVDGPAGPIQGQTTVTFVSGSPNSIALTATPTEIQVAGTGGVESSTIEATVRDPNGNLVEAAMPVYFELVNHPQPPQGCNINDRGQLDSAMTSNGVARVTINSGTQSGGVLVRAYTWRDIETRQGLVEVISPLLQVAAGPPWLLDIDVNNEGTDAGGGSWEIWVSVRVYDFYRNPVRNDLPVSFTVEPDIANIDPGRTGNEGPNNEVVQGLAFSRMVYNSNNTFDTLTIHATVVTEEGERSSELEHVLPLQEGDLQLNVSPITFMFDRNQPNLRCNIRVWGVLRDGHGVLINNGPVLFTTSRGYLFWRDFRGQYHELEAPEPAVQHTGWRAPMHQNYVEEDGIATVYLQGIMDDFFLDPFTLEVTVQLNATVVGYNDVAADPGFCFMTRH